MTKAPITDKRAAMRAIMKDIAEEAGWAMQNIRHEVVERGWAGREMTPESVHTLGNPFEQEPDREPDIEAEREAEREQEHEQDLER